MSERTEDIMTNALSPFSFEVSLRFSWKTDNPLFHELRSKLLDDDSKLVRYLRFVRDSLTSAGYNPHERRPFHVELADRRRKAPLRSVLTARAWAAQRAKVDLREITWYKGALVLPIKGCPVMEDWLTYPHVTIDYFGSDGLSDGAMHGIKETAMGAIRQLSMKNVV